MLPHKYCCWCQNMFPGHLRRGRSPWQRCRAGQRPDRATPKSNENGRPLLHSLLFFRGCRSSCSLARRPFQSRCTQLHFCQARKTQCSQVACETCRVPDLSGQVWTKTVRNSWSTEPTRSGSWPGKFPPIARVCLCVCVCVYIYIYIHTYV